MYSKLNEELTDSEVACYITRLGLETSNVTEASLATLNRLIFAHQCTVPFENIDIIDLNREISLNTHDLYNKIVTQNRGGYCFELNSIFCSLLSALGYDVTPLITRVQHGHTEKTLQIHRVTLARIGNESYFCDVGFGGTMPDRALKIAFGEKQESRDKIFYFAQGDSNWLLLNLDTPQGAFPLMEICQLPQEPIDFVCPNAYTSQSPTSMFRNSRIVNLCHPEGAIYITDSVLYKNLNGEKTSQEISTRREYYELLKSEFGIDIAL